MLGVLGPVITKDWIVEKDVYIHPITKEVVFTFVTKKNPKFFEDESLQKKAA